MEIVVITFLILLNGFFSLSEIALVSSKKTRLEQLRLKGSKGAGISIHLLNNSENFLSAIQVGITLIGIITGVYGGLNISDDIAPLFERIEFTRLYAHEIALTLTVILITYFSIVIGELVPKTIALSNPENIAIKIAPFISYFSRVFYPVVRILSISTNAINKFFGIKKQSEQFSEAELRQMMKTASLEGIIEKEQNLIHEMVFYFADKKAKHIMTHRIDVEWIDIDEPEDIVLNSVISSKHSKVVISRESLDNFVGILSIKEYLIHKNANQNFSITDILIKPIVIPENTSAQKVLDAFKKRKKYFAIVVNEYGGFEGIITLHDIMENLIGSIPAEDEQDEPDIFFRDDKSALVNGEAPIEIISQIIEDFIIDFEQIDYSTVAGFVFSRIDNIPQIGDKFLFAGYEFEIVDIDGNKIDKVLIKKSS